MKIKKLIKSFKFAFEGVFSCIKHERNFRIHICILLYVLYFSHFYPLTKIQYAVIIIISVLVLFAEMINTAIEDIIDMHIKSYNQLAKKAKDTAAGAVLICTAAAVAVGFLFFFDIDIIRNIIYYFIGDLVKISILIISLVISIIFIFLPGEKGNKNNFK